MFVNYKDSLFNDKMILKSQQRFRSDHHIVHTEEVNKIALSSHDDKRLQTYDKITTYPYDTNAFKVCESEMLSKNKLSVPDEDKDKDKTTPKTMTKTEDKDKDKTIPKTIVKIEDKDKTIPKTIIKTEDKDKDEPIPILHYATINLNRKTGNWIKRQIVCVHWNNEHISKLCRKWIRCGREYAYTRFEELSTYSGEVLSTRAHKATTSKRKPNIVIDINKLRMFKKEFNINR